MTGEIFRGELPLTKRHVCRRAKDARAVLCCSFIVRVNVSNVNDCVLVDLVRPRWTELAAGGAEHERGVLERQLRMRHTSVAPRCAKPFREAERGTEPIDRLRHIVVDHTGTTEACGADLFMIRMPIM